MPLCLNADKNMALLSNDMVISDVLWLLWMITLQFVNLSRTLSLIIYGKLSLANIVEQNPDGFFDCDRIDNN